MGRGQEPGSVRDRLGRRATSFEFTTKAGRASECRFWLLQCPTVLNLIGALYTYLGIDEPVDGDKKTFQANRLRVGGSASHLRRGAPTVSVPEFQSPLRVRVFGLMCCAWVEKLMESPIAAGYRSISDLATCSGDTIAHWEGPWKA